MPLRDPLFEAPRCIGCGALEGAIHAGWCDVPIQRAAQQAQVFDEAVRQLETRITVAEQRLQAEFEVESTVDEIAPSEVRWDPSRLPSWNTATVATDTNARDAIFGVMESWATLANNRPDVDPPRRRLLRTRPRAQTRPVAKRPKVLTLKRARQIFLDALEELSVDHVRRDFVMLLEAQFPRTPWGKLEKTAKRILQEAGLEV